MNATLYIIQHILDSSNNFYQHLPGKIHWLDKRPYFYVSIIRKDAHNTGLTHYTTMNC